MARSKLREFLLNEEWDLPFFKRLAKNDTAEGTNNQSGPLIPAALRHYLPTLDETGISSTRPTSDRNLRSELFVGLRQVDEATIRYQFQTWGNTRSPEGRLTRNLGLVYSQSAGGDILVMQRRIDSLDQFRLVLFRRTGQGYDEVDRLTRGRKWGSLYESEIPLSQNDLENAVNEIEALSNQPFVLKGPRKYIESRRVRIARSSAFPRRVGREYQWRCAVTGISLQSPEGLSEIQASHVVPVNEGGTDDIRNGLALYQTMHWAFDRGLFGINNGRRVYLPSKVLNSPGNDFLKRFNGRRMVEAVTETLRVHQEALDWHVEERVKQWDA
jgi:putative restriction endonuclease